MSIQVDPLTPQSRFLPDPVRQARASLASETPLEQTRSGGGRRRGTPPKRARCEVCGDGARVLILEGYAEGQPVLRRYCLRCAAAAPAETEVVGERPRMGVHVLVGLAGLVLCVVGLFGDYLVPPAHAGFGWHQQAGAAAGALILVIGLVLRMDVVALGGAFLLGASLCADWFGLTRGPGIGWKQQVMIAIGAAGLLTGGIRRKLVAARRTRRDPAHGRERGVAQGQSGGRAPFTEAASTSGAAPAAAP